MTPVEQFEVEDAQMVVFAKNQLKYNPLPALLFPDGRVLTEWCFTDEERAAIARGENLRLWIWTYNDPLQPVALEITDERQS